MGCIAHCSIRYTVCIVHYVQYVQYVQYVLYSMYSMYCAVCTYVRMYVCTYVQAVMPTPPTQFAGRLVPASTYLVTLFKTMVVSDWIGILPRKPCGGIFEKINGSRACVRVTSEGKSRLLQRSVMANFLWKVSRWPSQKTIVIELDKMRCKMLAMIFVPVAGPGSLDHYCRRRLRQARNVSQKLGF